MDGYRLAELVSAYRNHLATGSPATSPGGNGQVLSRRGNVAIIPLVGPLTKRSNLFMRLFGGTSTEEAGIQFSAALGDSTVKAIVLAIDSPGGTADGTQTFAQQVMQARGTKPIIAIADGTMCSAAYWIGSSADRVFATSGVCMVGSIGVVATHIDVSGREAQLGIKTTEITAGKYKRIASNYSPLSADGRENMQNVVDYLYTLFVSHVSQARGVSEQAVINQMADGRIFIGEQAVTAGLIDGIMSLDECIQGGVRANGDKVSDKGMLIPSGEVVVLQVGKRKFARVTIA